MTLPARGTPDWGIPTYEASAAQVDLGQVLSGLYHFDRVDQRGRVALVETWGEGIYGWRWSSGGAGVVPQVVIGLATIPAFVAPCLLEFRPGPLGGDSSTVARDVHLGSTKKVGIEAAVGVFTNVGEFVLEATYRQANGTRYDMQFIYDPIAGQWLLSTGTGVVVIATRPAIGSMVWHQVKMVGDWSTGKYTFVAIGDTGFDLTPLNYTMLNTGMTENGRCSAIMRAYGNSSGGALHPYCGYLALTRDEP